AASEANVCCGSNLAARFRSSAWLLTAQLSREVPVFGMRTDALLRPFAGLALGANQRQFNVLASRWDISASRLRTRFWNCSAEGVSRASRTRRTETTARTFQPRTGTTVSDPARSSVATT